jgi:hypothetical protein
MRFHKATEISSNHANAILESAWTSQNAHPVMNLFDTWFDIRLMTDNEVNSFTSDWMRNMAAEIQSGGSKPH